MDNTPSAGVWFREAGPLRFGTGNTERFRLDENGNARLGPGGNNTNSTNYSTLTIANTAGGVVEFMDSGNNNVAGDLIGAEGSGMYLSSKQDTPIIFRTGASSTEKARIEADGDIGLGTNSPNRSGYGAPVVSIGYNTSNNYSVLELQGNKTSDATVATIVGYNVGGTSRIAEISMGRDTGNNSGVISFLTYDGGSGNERTRIDHDGRLLHGSASNTGVAVSYTHLRAHET